MKGMFLHQQLEFRLEVAGDGFHQGDKAVCTLSVKNHGSNEQALAGLHLELAVGNLKKVKEKTGDAFASISKATFGAPAAITPQQQVSFPWTFELDRNCVVSDKNQSLYFLYGSEGAEGMISPLPLTVEPHPHIPAVLRILETSYQFVFKNQKSSSGWVQAKLKPPASARFSMVNELLLNFRFDGDALEMKYVFNVKRFEASVSSVEVKRAKTEVDQRLEAKEYLLPGGYFNHDRVEKVVEEALATVASGLE